MTAKRSLVALRNGAERRRAVRTILEEFAEQTRRNPRAGFDTLISLANDNLELLRPKSEAAKAFLMEARRRRDARILDDDTFAAESAPALMLTALYESLRSMFEAAKKSPDNYPLKCVAYATGVLVGHSEGNALRPGNYPRDDEKLVSALVASKITIAECMHSDVGDSLGDAPQLLGIRLPTFEQAASPTD